MGDRSLFLWMKGQVHENENVGVKKDVCRALQLFDMFFHGIYKSCQHVLMKHKFEHVLLMTFIGK